MPASYLEGLDVAQKAEGWRRGIERDAAKGKRTLVVEAQGAVIGFAVVGPDGAGPVPRAVHEHPVGQRHPAQADRRLSANRPRVGATWRRNRTPGSRSSTAIRSSAEWTSRAAIPGSIVRIGKKP